MKQKPLHIVTILTIQILFLSIIFSRSVSAASCGGVETSLLSCDDTDSTSAVFSILKIIIGLVVYATVAGIITWLLPDADCEYTPPSNPSASSPSDTPSSTDNPDNPDNPSTPENPETPNQPSTTGYICRNNKFDTSPSAEKCEQYLVNVVEDFDLSGLTVQNPLFNPNGAIGGHHGGIWLAGAAGINYDTGVEFVACDGISGIRNGVDHCRDNRNDSAYDINGNLPNGYRNGTVNIPNQADLYVSTTSIPGMPNEVYKTLYNNSTVTSIGGIAIPLFVPSGGASMTIGSVNVNGECATVNFTARSSNGTSYSGYYAHLSSYGVIASGTQITGSEIIGYIVSVKCTMNTSPHLHIQLNTSNDSNTTLYNLQKKLSSASTRAQTWSGLSNSNRTNILKTMCSGSSYLGGNSANDCIVYLYTQHTYGNKSNQEKLSLCRSWNNSKGQTETNTGLDPKITITHNMLYKHLGCQSIIGNAGGNGQSGNERQAKLQECKTIITARGTTSSYAEIKSLQTRYTDNSCTSILGLPLPLATISDCNDWQKKHSEASRQYISQKCETNPGSLGICDSLKNTMGVNKTKYDNHQCYVYKTYQSKS